MREILIRVLSTGFFVVIKEDGKIIDELACGRGRQSLSKLLAQYAYKFSDEKSPEAKEQKANKQKIK